MEVIDWKFMLRIIVGESKYAERQKRQKMSRVFNTGFAFWFVKNKKSVRL